MQDQYLNHLCFTVFEERLESWHQIGLCDLFPHGSLIARRIKSNQLNQQQQSAISNQQQQQQSATTSSVEHLHKNHLQLGELVSDHVAHPPGLVLSALPQGRHHL